jgi:hypothetical protein
LTLPERNTFVAAWISSSAKCGQAARGADVADRFISEAAVVSGVPFVVMIFLPFGFREGLVRNRFF